MASPGKASQGACLINARLLRPPPSGIFRRSFPLHSTGLRPETIAPSLHKTWLLAGGRPRYGAHRLDRLLGGFQLHPRRRMVARLLPTANIPVDPRIHQPGCHGRVEQQMIDTQTGIPTERVAEVIPEREDLGIWMELTYRVDPTLVGESH